MSAACLLAVAEPAGAQQVRSVTAKIEATLQPLMDCTVIMLPAAEFADWLTNDYPFACTTEQKGHCLYRNAEKMLPQPAHEDEGARQREVVALLAAARQRAQDFPAGTELHTLRMSYGFASFLLHQTAERCLRTILVIHAGPRLNTQSLDRPLRCCAMFSPEALHEFPQRSEKDKRLFALLQKSYVDAQYREDHLIKREELRPLTEKAAVLQALLSATSNRK